MGDARIVAVFEPRSNTMKLGTMQDRLAASLAGADLVYCYAARPRAGIRRRRWRRSARAPRSTTTSTPLVEALARVLRPGDHVLVMSNGGFGGIHAQAARAPGAIVSGRLH